jgi:peptidoglycan/xylan/chitin deacetylase (PgdA/CDA1 family)
MSWRGHPILCLYRCQESPWRRFLDELLVQEGYLCSDSLELDRIADLEGELEGRALTFVSADSLALPEAECLARHVREGGNVVLVRPPAELVEALPLEVESRPGRFYAEAPPGYIQFSAHPWAAHHDGACIQCHAPVALWGISGARTLAHVAPQFATASPFGAIVERECGQGRIAIFWFDVGTALVLARQGDPRLASTGARPDADGDGMHKASGLFYRHLDYRLRAVPQADILADVFVAVVRGLTDPLLPLPRIWHLPADAPALTLLDGDSDGFSWENYERLCQPCRKAGVPYTVNVLTQDFEKFAPGAVDLIFDSGNDLELHYWVGDHMASTQDAARTIPEQHARFIRFSGGRPSVASRGHCAIWPGYTEVAEILAKSGCRLETSFWVPTGYQYGYGNGSGRVSRFMTLDGRLLPISQQGLVFADDTLLTHKHIVPALTPDEAYEAITRTYAESVARYHGVITVCIHAGGSHMAAYGEGQMAMLDAVLDSTKQHRLPALTVRDWVTFQEARRELDLYLQGEAWFLRSPSAVRRVGCLMPAESGTRRQGLHWECRTFDLDADTEQQVS